MADILEALDAALRTNDGVEEVCGAFYGLAKRSTLDVVTNMLASLEDPLHAYPAITTRPVALLAGALVEIGADATAFPPAVFDHLLDALKAVDGPADESDHPDWFACFERAAMTCLSRSEQMRRSLPQRAEILANLKRYQDRYSFLGKMVQVLDGEPFVVIHPSSARGFRFTMTGVADNFQLHLLLLGVLAGSSPLNIPGKVPTRAAIAAASVAAEMGEESASSDWQLANWFALRPGGEIDGMDDTKGWIWNEGVPADIEPFEGTRVVLIGPSMIERGWNAQRVFPGMAANLDGPIPLAQAEVHALLERMLAARATRERN
jgi:hypothetical protein